MNNQAIIVIDFTYDFISIDGKLNCGRYGLAITETLVQLVQNYDRIGNYIVLAIDCHESDDVYHPENKLFPAHNIINLTGRELYGDLVYWYQQCQEQQHIYYMNKRRYSTFA